MALLAKCAQRIVNDYLADKDVVIICDKPHAKLARSIKDTGFVGAECLVATDKKASDSAFNFCLRQGKETLVFFEPHAFAEFQVYNWLDFSAGMPKISGLTSPSHVSILPVASTLRVYSSSPQHDAGARRDLLKLLRPYLSYKIYTDRGTELSFTARRWLDQGTEILTAPVEESINGKIAVDGALFFQRIDTVLDFFIEAGELVEIRAREKQHNDLVRLYRQMTDKDFAVRKNRQLAEVGFGYNTGAAISDCFMESEMAFGTAHFCFGNNACYGGKNRSDFHGGSVLIKRPQIMS